MATIGYHCSHEQFAPSRLLDAVSAAEHAGFSAAMCSDHFHPWSERQGHSGFAWSWLGAALATTTLRFGVVNAPGGRYHPAIIAQAAATLAEMFPGRFWLAAGSGQNLNEHITGERWPGKAERNARLRESVDIMRALWAGEVVGREPRGSDCLIRIQEAKLYTRPDDAPQVMGAAITPETAAWVAEWADGLITIARPHDELKEVVDAFRSSGGRGKPMLLQSQIAYHASADEARRQAHEQWRTNIFPSPVLATLEMPGHFDEAAELLQPADLDGHIRISADLEQHSDWIRSDVELGFDEIYLHHVGCDQDQFIAAFGEHVLPEFAAE